MQNIISINYQLFKSQTHRGGHTFMEAAERKQYISLYCIGASCNVFNVSVKLHDNQTLANQIETVWKAIKFVICYLEKNEDRSTYQQEICVDSHLNENINYTHKMASGPMLPILTCFYLATIVKDGVSLTVETYGGKLSKRVVFQPTANVEMTLEDADNIANQLRQDLPSSAPFIISELHSLISSVAKEFGIMELPLTNNRLIIGIGCTVATEMDLNDRPCHADEINLISESSLSQRNKLFQTTHLINNLKSERIPIKSNEDRMKVAAFTVINIENPPFAALSKFPSKWFLGAPTSSDISSVDEDNSSENIEGHSDDDSETEDSQAVDDKNTDDVASKKVMYPNVAVACKSHVTYPGFGGILPFCMQSITIENEKHLKSKEFLDMTNVVRVMCYNVSGRLATGEYNVDLKCSTETGRVDYDISGTVSNAAFNMKSCMDRQDSFARNNETTLQNMKVNGSPARIEIAFLSPSPSEDLVTIAKGLLIPSNQS